METRELLSFSKTAEKHFFYNILLYFSEKLPDLFFTASLGVRWMIGQTEINKGSSYGEKEVPLNNN